MLLSALLVLLYASSITHPHAITVVVVYSAGAGSITVGGAGFAPGEAVTVRVWGIDKDGNGHWITEPIIVHADASGGIKKVVPVPSGGISPTAVTIERSGSTPLRIPI